MDTACTTEAHALCAVDANLLALLERASVRNAVKIQERRQRVWDCLVDHADELSPPCVAALVGNAATTQSAVPANDGDAEEVSADSTTPPTEVSNEEPKDTQDILAHATSVPEVVPAAVPAVVPAEIVTTPSVPVQAQPQLTEGQDSGVEVRIFLINHPGVAAAAPAAATPYIRIGGDANQYSGGDHPSSLSSSGMAMPAWLWVTMLPFLCIGFYVSVTQTISFIRRRRDVVYRVGSTQYMPIPSSLGGK